MSQAAILITDNLGNIIFKSVYSGNTGFADSEASRFHAKYPSYTVTKYGDDQDPAVANAILSNPQNIEIK